MQASNPPFIRFCKKLGLLPEKVSFYLSDSFFLLLSLVIAFCIRAALPGFSFDLTLYLKIVLIVLLGPLCLGLPLGVYMGIPTPSRDARLFSPASRARVCAAPLCQVSLVGLPPCGS